MDSYDTVTRQADTEISERIKKLSNDELKQLLNASGKMDELIVDLPQVKRMQSDKDTILTSNKSLAQFNLDLKPQLADARELFLKTYDEAVALKSQLDTKMAEIGQIQENRSLETAVDLLKIAVREAENNSEALSKQFSSGELPLDQFLGQYLELRKLHHLRKAKVEKLTHLNDHNQSSTSQQIGSQFNQQQQQPMFQSNPYNQGYASNGVQPSQFSYWNSNYNKY